jgi:uncharacterized protein YwqG
MVDIYKWLFGARGKAALAHPMPPLPDLLRPHADAIFATVQPIIGVTSIHGAPASPYSSQLGGRPWWPKGRPFPRGLDGQPLYLLIQINFAELPRLDPYPTSGLLQMFIAANDLFGMNPDDLTAPAGFRCIFHESVEGPADAESAPRTLPTDGYLPLENPLDPLALSFGIDRMPIDVGDYRFEKLLPGVAADEDLMEAYAEWTTDEAAVSAIRLGGYPSFTQEDPRAYRKHAGIGDTTLLTVDTTTGIMWGDSGVAQFFMHDADLRRRDFSRVVYSWDCC